MKHLLFLSCIAAVLILQNCKLDPGQEEDFNTIAKAYQNTEITYNSTSTLVQAVACKQLYAIIPEFMSLNYTDSIVSDGTGVQFYLDFKNGVECKDGIFRKGKLLFNCNKKLQDYPDTISLTSSSVDSFIAISNKQQFLFINLNCSYLHSFFYKKGNIGFECKVQKNTKKSDIEIAANGSIDYVNSNAYFSFHTQQNHTLNLSCKDGNSISISNSTNLGKSDRCSAYFSTGTVLFNLGGIFLVETNPINNAACDDLIKIKKGDTERLFNYFTVN